PAAIAAAASPAAACLLVLFIVSAGSLSDVVAGPSSARGAVGRRARPAHLGAILSGRSRR
ncbi:hypothetical protein, partial [Streptomyces sp. SID14436]